ncbi:hypothetical protein LG275_03810 [Chryseomicrobium palamuruense]
MNESEKEIPEVLNQETLEDLYIQKRLTDREIAKLYELDRTSIVHRRKAYGIKTRNKIVTPSVNLVKQKLLELGYQVTNLKDTDKTAPYDLLLNGRIRVEVVAAGVTNDNSFKFLFGSSSKRELIESEYRIQLPNGRFKKIYRKTCDFFVFCGIENSDVYYWIMPSGALPDTMQTLSLRIPPSQSKYECYADAWNLLKRNADC